MTKFCLLLLLVAVCIVHLHCTVRIVLPLFILGASVQHHLCVCFAVNRSVCVHYSQISFTTLSCPEYYSHLCLGVGWSVIIRH